MRGNVRYWLCAAILLLLGFLFLVRPDTEGLIKVQSGPLLKDLQDELEGLLEKAGHKLDTEQGTQNGDDARKKRLALLALGNKPLPVSLRMQLPPRVLDDTRWVQAFEKNVTSSSILELREHGTPLTLSFGTPADTTRLELRLASTTDVSPAVPAIKDIAKATDLATFWGLLPPFLIILLAVLFGRTIPSLLAGVLLGAFLAVGPLNGLWHFAYDYVYINVFNETFRWEILGFVLMLSASIGIMTRSGGIEGMVELVKRFARTARSSQFVAWIMGLLIFFDDYANTIVVGSTMRPLTDRLKVSREKLAYIVDSTAAPIAGLAVLSTWVVTEISYFEPTLKLVQGADGNALYEGNEGFAIFLESMRFRFYCLLTIFMVVTTVLLKRDFGPMLAAERRARHEGKPIADGARPMVDESMEENLPKEGVPRRWWNGVLPILTLVFVTVVLIAWTGSAALTRGEMGFLTYVREVVGNSDSSFAIFWGATMAVVLAGVLSIAQGILRPIETFLTGVRSMRALSFAVAILILAWCIGFVCRDLGTDYYLIAMTERGFAPELLPTVLFLTACLVAFATGSSWSTMAILLPNVVLMAHSLGQRSPIGGHGLMLLSIGAVLEGSIFGDHCSPISDTTVLSSVGSASDHLHHVRTQAPYAVFVMLTCMIFGYLPVAFISPDLWPLSLLLGAGFITFFLLVVGRNPEQQPAEA